MEADRKSIYGDPTEWDWIPKEWTEEFTRIIEAYGHTVIEAHDTAIAIDSPHLHLKGDETWFVAMPNFHGLWSYGVDKDEKGCPNPCWIYADAADPQQVAATVHAILIKAPLARFWHGGTFAVYAKTEPVKEEPDEC